MKSSKISINKATENLFKLIKRNSVIVNKKKIYIAGKITGDKDYKSKFNRFEMKLKKKGYIVLNPAWMPEGMSPKDYMRICFAMIDTADTVLFLKDYKESKGARLEFNYCRYTGKKVVFDA